MRATHASRGGEVTIAELRAVLAVAEHRSFSAAGIELEVAQSSVSRAVRALERKLGAVLFERTAAGAKLTTAGRAVLGDVERALALIDGLPALGSASVGGLVRIGSFRSAAEHLLPPAIRGITELNPLLTLRVSVIAERSGAVAAAVGTGAVDLGITSLPVARELLAVTLLADPYVRVEPSRASDEELRFILWDEDCSRKALAWHDQHFPPVPAALELDDDRAVLSHIAAGLGYSIMPALSTVGFRGIRRLPLADGPVRSVGLISSLGAMRRPEVAAVHSILKRALDGARSIVVD
jgi:DNA-binding transcriptional LysR family regulator